MAEEKKDKSSNSKQNTPLIVMVAGILLALVAPGLLTQFYWPWPGWSFQDTGPIGDTIGGIAGPILNLTGLVLVYYSFKEQYEANNELRNDFERQNERIEKERNYELLQVLLEKLKIQIQSLNTDLVNKELYRILVQDTLIGDYTQDMKAKQYDPNFDEEELKKRNRDNFNNIIKSDPETNYLMQIINIGKRITKLLESGKFYEEEKTYLKDEFVYMIDKFFTPKYSEIQHYINSDLTPQVGPYIKDVVYKSEFHLNIRALQSYISKNQL